MRRAFALLVSAIAVLSAHEAVAQSSTVVRTSRYPIEGSTAAELRAQMKRDGPKGSWAYTHWYVRWTGTCQVSLQIDYTYPRWINEKQAPAALQRNWEHMMSRLRLHEDGHAQHGRNAAREIAQSHCSNPMAIIHKWAAQDAIYDRETQHGRKQGVALP